MYRMLLVDDDEFILNLMQTRINWSEIDVEIVGTASDGEEGLIKIRELLPDIVMADIDMPKVNGIEMVSEIRKMKLETQVIMLTGFDDFKHAQQAIGIGVCDYITKPAMPDDIIKSTKRAVEICRQKKRKKFYDKNKVVEAIKSHNKTIIENEFFSIIANIQEQEKIFDLEFVSIALLEMYSLIYHTMHNSGDHSAFELKMNKDIWKSILELQSINDAIDILNAILEDINKGNKKKTRNGKIAEDMIRYVEENYMNNISLNSLSKSLYLTTNYLGDIFKSETGMYFKDYLKVYRIQMAKQLLLGGEHTISEVSEMVGYKNIDYFRKSFRAVVGVNPSEFVLNT